jgi:hypothetical protein
MNLEKVMELYVEITKECPIGTLGPPFTYYHNEQIKSNVLATDLVELDVKSAFPTICRLYFGEKHQFVKEIERIDGKLKKNIYIATTLKAQSQVDGKPYLNELNLWSKILILGYTYCKYDSISILQYVKDGAVLKGELRNEITPDMDKFLQFTIDSDIIFHDKPIDLYVRFNKTSIIKYFSSSEYSIKGSFRNLPKYIHDEVLTSFFNGEIYNKQLLLDIKNKYSKLFFEILYNSHLKEDIDYYYLINDKYLDINGKLGQLKTLDPKIYLLQIIYPILSLLRSG